MKMEESSSKGQKTLWEKEKLLFTSNFSFSHCFQKACFPGASKGVVVWEWVKMPFTTIVAFVARFVQPDLISTLSVVTKAKMKCNYFGHISRTKMSDEFNPNSKGE